MNLPMWTVYEHPSDYPAGYVARKWLIGPGPVATDEVLMCREIGPIREQMTAWGLTCITRAPGDDPVIVETWM